VTQKKTITTAQHTNRPDDKCGSLNPAGCRNWKEEGTLFSRMLPSDAASSCSSFVSSLQESKGGNKMKIRSKQEAAQHGCQTPCRGKHRVRRVSTNSQIQAALTRPVGSCTAPLQPAARSFSSRARASRAAQRLNIESKQTMCRLQREETTSRKDNRAEATGRNARTEVVMPSSHEATSASRGAMEKTRRPQKRVYLERDSEQLSFETGARHREIDLAMQS
jgi:hypothetical protein